MRRRRNFEGLEVRATSDNEVCKRAARVYAYAEVFDQSENLFLREYYRRCGLINTDQFKIKKQRFAG